MKALAAVLGALAVPSPAIVNVALDHPVNSFQRVQALGAALDGHEHGDTPIIYTRRNLRAMRSSGLGAITYRLRTELGVEAWHWNRRGRWSDPAHHRGYWTSSSRAGRRIEVSYGYRLPRRGDTIDQANDNGYSRLDDGNLRTFWKSNPYLAGRPSWLLVDFGRHRPVDAVRLDWGTPYARRFRVQYWAGPQAIFQAGHPPGRWRDFPRARFTGHGGRQTLRVARAPRRVRFVRVLMTRSSRTALPGSTDVRDRLGYAVREAYVGVMRGRGFRDLMRHGRRASRQTVTYVSSTDPWHRASDIDRNYEQPGFDRVATSGLLRRQPMLVPVSLLYGTPANAVAELRWLRARHIAVRGVELGEEPDGQLITPEDYGALYAKFARRIHRALPDLKLGGPGYQTSIPDWVAWPNAAGDRSWTRRFMGELRARGALTLWNFFSFEWYPFDNVCAPAASQLAREPGLLAGVLQRQHQEGLPPDLPVYVTEYGYSAFAGEPEVDLPGALLNAELTGQLLSLGGDAAFLYGYEPDALIRESTKCNTWGNLTLFLSDFNRLIHFRLPTYYASQLITRQWAGPGRNVVYAASSSVPAVQAYALRRADGSLAVMLVNADPSRSYSVSLGGPLDVFQLSGARYAWQPRGEHGRPRLDLPPAHTSAPGGEVVLPPFSLTIARRSLETPTAPIAGLRGVPIASRVNAGPQTRRRRRSAARRRASARNRSAPC